LLTFEFEGVSLQTRFDDVPGILARAGYVRNPRPEKYLLEFYHGDLLLNGTPVRGFSTRPGGKPGYVIRVRTDLDNKTGDVQSVECMRPLTTRYGPPFAEQLTDTLDVALARRFKAIICKHIDNERERWAACPPDTAFPAEDREVTRCGLACGVYISG